MRRSFSTDRSCTWRPGAHRRPSRHFAQQFLLFPLVSDARRRGEEGRFQAQARGARGDVRGAEHQARHGGRCSADGPPDPAWTPPSLYSSLSGGPGNKKQCTWSRRIAYLSRIADCVAPVSERANNEREPSSAPERARPQMTASWTCSTSCSPWRPASSPRRSPARGRGCSAPRGVWGLFRVCLGCV